MCVCMCVCVYIYIYIYKQIYTHIHKHPSQPQEIIDVAGSMYRPAFKQARNKQEDN